MRNAALPLVNQPNHSLPEYLLWILNHSRDMDALLKYLDLYPKTENFAILVAKTIGWSATQNKVQFE